MRMTLMACTAVHLILPLLAVGQDAPIDKAALMQELSQETPDQDAMTTVSWWPAEAMAILWELEPEEAAVLEDYTVFLIQDGIIGPMGGITWVAPEDLRRSVSLIDAAGLIYEPLEGTDLTADMRMFITAISSTVSAELKQAVGVFAFPAKRPDGRAIADPLDEGRFHVVVGSRSFKWITPLGSLLPPKRCPVDGRKMNGGWNYCPWHGVELE